MIDHKSKPDLLIRFTGNQISPERIPISVLTRAMSAIQRLALGREPEDEEEYIEATSIGEIEHEEGEEIGPGPKALDDWSLRLVGVVRGSAVFRCVSPDPIFVQQNLRLAGSFLRHPEEPTERSVPVKPIEDLSKISRMLGCSISLEVPDGKGEVLARFEHDSYEHISTIVFIRGETSLTGKMVRVGGATALRCALRIPTQSRLVYARVANAELGRKLGQWLYQDVTVLGRATWLRTDWSVVKFYVTGIEEPKSRRYLQALDAAAKAGNHGWDKVEDPEAFLADLMGR
jgi:hypothetical protein